ncbi:endolytic transglycosylase MltG [Halpernia sp.]|uniref:endolytic transglycosylase MltG n=1 Tax=Halpernia sp. TaxID=2782209 RepID=UPI003A947DBA
MKKAGLSVAFLVLAAVIFFGFRFYEKSYANNVEKEGYVLVPHNASFNQIVDSISPYLKDKKQFIEVARSKKLGEFYNAGRYKIKYGTGNNDLVNMIKSGNQTEDSFRIGDFDDVYQMIGRVTKKTELDSLKFVNGFEKIAKEKKLNSPEDLKPYFFIDTYNFFWTVKPKEFFKKFEKEYNQFWNAERVQKEKNLGLDRNQIYALASIVYKESGGKPDEMKTIAGLYLNRFHKGMKLQSDPTVIYAVNKASNYSKKIKRVYFKDLKQNSPYNTYANVGIPPGPICMVDKNSVDAVLNAENNNYIYMCADPNHFGFHKFTDNPAQHAINAKAYQDWLNAKDIK